MKKLRFLNFSCLNLLKMIDPSSNSYPEFSSSRAMVDASPKVGGFLPTSLKDTRNWSEWVLQENQITQSSLKEYFCRNNTGNEGKYYHFGSSFFWGGEGGVHWMELFHPLLWLFSGCQELRTNNQASLVLYFSMPWFLFFPSQLTAVHFWHFQAVLALQSPCLFKMATSFWYSYCVPLMGWMKEKHK